MPINSRQKGARGERELAEVLRTHGHTARRGQQFSGGADSPDVVCPTLSGYHIECKRVEKGNLYDWLAQAKRDAGQKVPVVMHKKNRQEWVVILPLENFLALCRPAEAQSVHECVAGEEPGPSTSPSSQMEIVEP